MRGINSVALDKWIEGDPFAGEAEFEAWYEALWNEPALQQMGEIQGGQADQMDKWADRLYEKSYLPADAAPILIRAFLMHIQNKK